MLDDLLVNDLWLRLDDNLHNETTQKEIDNIMIYDTNVYFDRLVLLLYVRAQCTPVLVLGHARRKPSRLVVVLVLSRSPCVVASCMALVAAVVVGNRMALALALVVVVVVGNRKTFSNVKMFFSFTFSNRKEDVDCIVYLYISWKL